MLKGTGIELVVALDAKHDVACVDTRRFWFIMFRHVHVRDVECNIAAELEYFGTHVPGSANPRV